MAVETFRHTTYKPINQSKLTVPKVIEPMNKEVLMFAFPTVSELRFYGYCHPCFLGKKTT